MLFTSQTPHMLPSCKSLLSLCPEERTDLASLGRNFYYEPQLDPCCPICGWLWKELRSLPLCEWLELHHLRDPDRKPYGDQIPTKRARYSCRSILSKVRHESDSRLQHQTTLDVRLRGKRRHGRLEKERRERHRILQQMGDIGCSEFHFAMAKKRLSDLKLLLGHEKLSNQPNSAKDTGKDEQLLATVFQQHMASWILQAQIQQILQVFNPSPYVVLPVEHSNGQKIDFACRVGPQFHHVFTDWSSHLEQMKANAKQNEKHLSIKSLPTRQRAKL